MGRNEKRHPRKDFIKVPTLGEMAIENSRIFIANTAVTVNNCYFKAMRNNNISEKRANKILVEVKELIRLETLK